MKIAVNTRLLLSNNLDGIGWFTYETLKRITKQHTEHEFIFLFDRKFSDEFIFSTNIKPIVISPQARHPFLFYLWFEHSVRRVLKKEKPDMFLSPDGFLSLSSDVKQLAVIHDLNFEEFPYYLPFLVRKYYRYYFPKFSKKATRIATVSEFSKNDIVMRYGISPNKIDVVHNGANENYKPIPESEKIHTRKKISSEKPYFLFIGTLHPRKNISKLLLAFEKFKSEKNSDVQLMLVGNKMWWTDEMENAFQKMKFKKDVSFTGRLEPEQLCKVISSALAMVYVSTYEGFGIPILEAMKCEIPVITSNVTSMPEVAGDAGLLVNPFSVDEIKNAMQKIYSDENLRKDLVEKGKIQREKFSWQKTADKLWTCIEKTLDN